MSREAGTQGEEIAILHLSNKGYTLVEKNFTCKQGEIDIIMMDGTTLVFVEVKTYHPDNFADIHRSITVSKKRKLLLAAQAYFAKINKEVSARFDMVAIHRTPASQNIEHFQGIFF